MDIKRCNVLFAGTQQLTVINCNEFPPPFTGQSSLRGGRTREGKTKERLQFSEAQRLPQHFWMASQQTPIQITDTGPCDRLYYDSAGKSVATLRVAGFISRGEDNDLSSHRRSLTQCLLRHYQIGHVVLFLRAIPPAPAPPLPPSPAHHLSFPL